MHNFILMCFRGLKNLLHFFKIASIFCIMMLAMYWIENIIHANWSWLDFITPFLKNLLIFANSIYSISFNLFGATIEIKYINALIILIAIYYLMNLLNMLLVFVEQMYKSTHFLCKKVEENVLNKTLKEKISSEEKKISNYSVVIQTRIKSKYSHKEIGIDIVEQNELMNDFIYKKLNVKPTLFEDGFFFAFDNFNNIDATLDILFKILHSTAPLDYAICIQAGNNIKQLKKLLDLKNYGKVTMAADTSFRYKFNVTHRYQTSQVGIFQYENKTIEVHEFQEFL